MRRYGSAAACYAAVGLCHAGTINLSRTPSGPELHSAQPNATVRVFSPARSVTACCRRQKNRERSMFVANRAGVKIGRGNRHGTVRATRPASRCFATQKSVMPGRRRHTRERAVCVVVQKWCGVPACAQRGQAQGWRGACGGVGRVGRQEKVRRVEEGRQVGI